MIDLPYGDGDFSMTVLLPNQGKSVDDLISLLDNQSWDQWIGGLYENKATLYLPKFKIEYELEMKDVLTALGMGIAFDGGADFTGINPTMGLYLDRVIHKTYVDVNEEGTEAAAVTSVVVTYESMGTEMRVNRPFVFVIRETNSGSILFMGKIVEPML